jgi:hypothetical protein
MGLAIPSFEHQTRVELGEIRVEFGVNGIPNNGILTEKLRYITAGYLSEGLTDSWPLKLQQTMQREEDNGAKVTVPDERAILSATIWIPPLTAAPIQICMETTRYEESLNVIQCAWKAGWSITAYRCSQCGERIVEVSYGIMSKSNRDIKQLWKDWMISANTDWIQIPIEMQGNEIGFDCMGMKRDQTITVHFEKRGTDALEVSERSFARPFGKKVTVLVWHSLKWSAYLLAGHCEGILRTFFRSNDCGQAQGMIMGTGATIHRTEEEICLPREVRLRQVVEANRTQELTEQIRWQGWRMQNLDKGIDRFIWHSKMERPVATAIGIQQGFYGECGWGMYLDLDK